MSKGNKVPSSRRNYAYLAIGIFSLGYGAYRVISLYENYQKYEIQFAIAIGFVAAGVICIYRFFKSLK
ncbi:hypothetical protein [Zunongwangia sp. HRR-M8]|uniref:hypothetical protein n=1 Tax=Zunongwangia sp. HRR-M8 TaxID=3015170 RepID=UPI0022DE3419|nr:hypothetical protein [Zunongwangia sp. HRR-M8]WBL23262.1 hypothetical protein PBT89_04740 [Zunongwangia sp. HRR-M8]